MYNTAAEDWQCSISLLPVLKMLSFSSGECFISLKTVRRKIGWELWLNAQEHSSLIILIQARNYCMPEFQYILSETEGGVDWSFVHWTNSCWRICFLSEFGSWDGSLPSCSFHSSWGRWQQVIRLTSKRGICWRGMGCSPSPARTRWELGDSVNVPELLFLTCKIRLFHKTASQDR